MVRELCKDAPVRSRNLRDNHNEEESDDDSDDDDDDEDIVNRKNYDGKTALHLATAAGKLRMLQVGCQNKHMHSVIGDVLSRRGAIGIVCYIYLYLYL